MKNVRRLILIAVFVFAANAIVSAQSFTYQGKLTDGGNPANSQYDLAFRLFDAAVGGTQVGLPVLKEDVQVTGGVFTVDLDFGSSPFTSATGNYLEIWVRLGTDTGAFTPLSPRQPITKAPYSIQSEHADTATSASNFSGTLSGEISGTQGATVVSSIGGQSAANVASAIQSINAATSANTPNTLVLRDANGDLSANIVNAATQYNIGGLKALSLSNFSNLFAGPNSGDSITVGQYNAFFGYPAGRFNTSGNANSFFGTSAGSINTTGSLNTALGYAADFGSENLTNATAIGFRAQVAQSNSLVLGSINTVNGATADTNVGIGTTTPSERLNVVGNGLFTGNLTATQFNIGVSRVLSIAGNENLFAGVGTGLNNTGIGNTFVGTNAGRDNAGGGLNVFVGTSAGIKNTTGSNNSFFGVAGLNNTTGFDNSFFGLQAGAANVAGNNNSFFGRNAGASSTTDFNSFFGGNSGVNTTTGAYNSFFGINSGSSNTIGDRNAFFGSVAGFSNTTGARNSFFGTDTGVFNTTGNNNSFFGRDAGRNNTTGSGNVFSGFQSGLSNVTGSNNTTIGNDANVGSGSLTFATALGSGAIVGTSNTVMLGRSLDTVQIPGALNVSGSTAFGGTLGANILNATTQYNIGGSRLLSVAGTNNLFAGVNAGAANASGDNNSFFGNGSGTNNTSGASNTFVGSSSGLGTTFGSFNTLVGAFADATGDPFFGPSHATAIGYRALVTRNYSIVLGGITGVNGGTSTNVGIGTTAPLYRLHVVGENVRVENSTFPRFSLNFTGGAVDEKKWQNYAGTNSLNFSALNDAENAETFWLNVNRGAGTSISSVVFPNGNVVINNLGAPGSTSVCRNSLNQISTCTFGSVTENGGAESTAAVNALREQLKQQKKEIDELKQVVCAIKPDAAVCNAPGSRL